jgi:hypothetical protein
MASGAAGQAAVPTNVRLTPAQAEILDRCMAARY